MKNICSIAASDLALCQKCPALLAYKVHKGKKSAWRVGIKGNGEAYGSIFHKYIARTFFEGASNSYHPLHQRIKYAVSGSESELEDMIRENIFLPFIERHAVRFKSENLFAMAKGVTVWVKAMSEFFRCIPSLRRHDNFSMRSVFKEPERKLQGIYDFYDGNKLIITGCYDALMFNPDEGEVRIFEFKGYRKSDITVSLSQSLIYSWLIWKDSGIVPSVEIIYLGDEDRSPNIFDSRSVVSMMRSALPKLFYSAFNIISLRRIPETLRNINLCPSCRYSKKCEDDMTKLFRRESLRRESVRKGSSLVNVLVFFMIALMITAQAFFFLTNSAESVAEEREMMQVRLKLDALVDDAKYALNHFVVPNDTIPYIGLISKDYHSRIYTITAKSGDKFIEYGKYGTDFYVFYDGRNNQNNAYDSKTKLWESTNKDVAVFDLNYRFLYEANDSKNDTDGLAECIDKIKDDYVKIFPPLGENYFLIRARVKLSAGNYIMRQVVMHNGNQQSEEEVFYWDAD